jgi:hypothetical protein
MSENVREDVISKIVRVKINGEEYSGLDTKEAVGIALQPMLPHLKYMSRENVGKYINDIKEMLENDLSMKVSTTVTNFLTNIKEMREDKVMVAVYDLLLNIEGLGMGKRYGS